MRTVFLMLLVAFCPGKAAAQSTSTTVPQAIAAQPRPSGDARLSHLLKAADHLESAGLVDKAQEIRDLAGKEQRWHDALQKTIAARDALTEEIHRLRQLTGEHEQVAVYATMHELSLSKLRQADVSIDGIDLELLKSRGFGAVLAVTRFNEPDDARDEGLPAGRQQSVRFAILENDHQLSELTRALQKAGVLKTLAEPALVTTSGRHASFFSGGEFPIVVPGPDGDFIEHRRFGTQLDCLPILLGNDRIRLEVKPGISQIDTARSVVSGDQVIPGLRVRHVDTAVEMNLGQTLVLSGLFQNVRPPSPDPNGERAPSKEPPTATERRQKADPAAADGGSEEVELIVTIRAENLQEPRVARQPK